MSHMSACAFSLSQPILRTDFFAYKHRRFCFPCSLLAPVALLGIFKMAFEFLGHIIPFKLPGQAYKRGSICWHLLPQAQRLIQDDLLQVDELSSLIVIRFRSSGPRKCYNRTFLHALLALILNLFQKMMLAKPLCMYICKCTYIYRHIHTHRYPNTYTSIYTHVQR